MNTAVIIGAVVMLFILAIVREIRIIAYKSCVNEGVRYISNASALLERSKRLLKEEDWSEKNLKRDIDIFLKQLEN